MTLILGFRRVFTVTLAAIASAIAPFPSVAQPDNRAGELPTLVLVRHADTAAQPDRPLSAAGLKRAQDIAMALRDARVTAIITTQLRRTRETAQPLATALGLVPQVVSVGERALLNLANPASDAPIPPEVANERAEYIKVLEPVVRRLSGVVLVVGHDWSTPGLIASLGGPQLPNICPSVYDKLFVLTFSRGKANLIQAHYGEPTPDNCK
jgi:phosphohistidine phosphatase SixA